MKRLPPIQRAEQELSRRIQLNRLQPIFRYELPRAPHYAALCRDRKGKLAFVFPGCATAVSLARSVALHARYCSLPFGVYNAGRWFRSVAAALRGCP